MNREELSELINSFYGDAAISFKNEKYIISVSKSGISRYNGYKISIKIKLPNKIGDFEITSFNDNNYVHFLPEGSRFKNEPWAINFSSREYFKANEVIDIIMFLEKADKLKAFA